MHQHPRQAGRMVLDGVINPAWDTEEEAVQSTAAFGTALDAFVKDCVQRGADTCPLGDDPKEAEAVLSQLNQSLDGKTLPTKTGSSPEEWASQMAAKIAEQSLYERSSGALRFNSTEHSRRKPVRLTFR
ncbi:hypothetical protein [Streptomyces sp. NPDC051218]|uniref:hypothetical protein n=1 Tax=Streptomyces sp. NPDC051218 TaxID=3365645 RepID=UPI003795B83C